MKKFNILMTTSALALLTTGCVKPVQDTQAIYNDGTQGIVIEEAQPIVYDPNINAGNVYEEVVQPDGTVIMTSTTGGQATMGGQATVVGQPIGGEIYPDPYAGGGTTAAYSDPYTSQPVLTDYPASSYPTAPSGQGGGIHLQIAALKDYFTAEDYKNRLSLAPGMSAYVQRGGAMSKVIVTGIPSLAEANRLKETRFPGAFIVQGGTSGGYTPSVQPSYDTSSGMGVYNVNNPYGTASSTVNTGSGIGVQIAALATKGKAQSLANNQGGRYPATVKKIGKYYKVILTGFSSRSAAKAHASRVGGFVVNY